MTAQEMGKVAVLFGGKSTEREVSLMSGQGVLDALRSQGIDAHAFDPALRPLDELRTHGFARVFIAMHGRGGEDGSLQGALELLGVPYTGSGVMASAICMDKITTKRLWQTDNLPTPRYRVVQSDQVTRTGLETIAHDLGLPLIMKAPHEGSTLGLAKVSSLNELESGFATASALDDYVLIEEFIRGRELTVTVLGEGKAARALPIIEIVAPEGNYDFQNKYYTNVTRYVCPAEIPAELTSKIQDLALNAYRSVGCSGWGRVDILLRDSDQSPQLLEINTSPGMTGHSLVPIAAKAVGIDYPELCMMILASAGLKMKGVA